MSKSIIRVQKNRENPYVMMNKEFLSNNNLSWKAKGLLAYLLSKPDNWKVIIEDIIKQSTDGEKSVRSGIKELIENRYMQKYPVYENGHVIFWETTVYEQPIPDDEVIKNIKIVNGEAEVNYKDLLSQNRQVVGNTVLAQNVKVGNVQIENEGLLNNDLSNNDFTNVVVVEEKENNVDNSEKEQIELSTNTVDYQHIIEDVKNKLTIKFGDCEYIEPTLQVIESDLKLGKTIVNREKYALGVYQNIQNNAKIKGKKVKRTKSNNNTTTTTSNTVSHKKTGFHNFEETFTKYDPDEFNDMVDKLQDKWNK